MFRRAGGENVCQPHLPDSDGQPCHGTREADEPAEGASPQGDDGARGLSEAGTMRRLLQAFRDWRLHTLIAKEEADWYRRQEARWRRERFR